jgi:hypothetical protein
MGRRLKYESGRPFFAVLVLAALYFLVLPGLWPEPSVDAKVSSRVALGADVEAEVTVRAWHPNFRVRQISFFASNVTSTALMKGKKPFVPINLLEREKTDQWHVGFGSRMSWPRSRSFRLAVPLRDLTLKSELKPGELHGTIDVVVDHTKVTVTSGYPSRTSRYKVPYSIVVGR